MAIALAWTRHGLVVGLLEDELGGVERLLLVIIDY